MRISDEFITDLKKDEYFVFGSNRLGAHAGGAAKLAHEKFGALWGKAEGFQGQSYAINSMDGLGILKEGIERFINSTKIYTNHKFLVTEIGCGIAGHTVEEVAPMFEGCIELENVYLPKRFFDYLTKAQ